LGAGVAQARYEGPAADRDGCSFGPEALKAIGQAFDTAWQEIAGNFGSDAVEVEAARLQLASALLSIANEESRNAAVLKRAALERMALDYKDRPAGSQHPSSSKLGAAASGAGSAHAGAPWQTWGFSKRGSPGVILAKLSQGRVCRWAPHRGASAAPKTRARNRPNSRRDQNIAGVPLCL